LKCFRKVKDIREFYEFAQNSEPVGRFASVYRCVSKTTNKACAIKVINKKLLENSAIGSKFLNEIRILEMLDHPSIVREIELIE